MPHPDQEQGGADLPVSLDAWQRIPTESSQRPHKIRRQEAVNAEQEAV
jgi:hypothetical protein